jgi:hypothetical protein
MYGIYVESIESTGRLRAKITARRPNAPARTSLHAEFPANREINRAFHRALRKSLVSLLAFMRRERAALPIGQFGLPQLRHTAVSTGIQCEGRGEPSLLTHGVDDFLHSAKREGLGDTFSNPVTFLGDDVGH